MSRRNRRAPRAERARHSDAAPNPVVAPAKPKNVVVTTFAVDQAQQKPARDTREIDPAKLFAPYPPMPGVLPQGKTPIAMDSALTPWVASQYESIAASMIEEGQTFLGFPILSELAQRAEIRIIVDTIATEMTRKFIRFKAKGEQNKTDRIAELNAAFHTFRVRKRFKEMAEHDGFFGRGHLYAKLGEKITDDELATDIGDGWNKVTKSKVKKGSLLGFRPIEPVWCYPADYGTSDPLSDTFYAPQSWFVMGKKVHASRLRTFIGREVPDLFKPAYAYGGLPLSQMLKPYVQNWLETRQSVNDLVQAFSTMVLSTDMSAVLEGGPATNVLARVDVFNATRSNRGAMVVDKNAETLTNVSTPLSGLDKLQAQAQEHISSIARTPLVKWTGISPSGLNASSDGEIRVYYDFIKSEQESLFGHHLHFVTGVVMHHLWGEADPDIESEFVELWEMTAKEKAEIEKMQAETDAILINDCNAIAPAESRARVAGDIDSSYHGLDPEDMPEPPTEEGLVGSGGVSDDPARQFEGRPDGQNDAGGAAGRERASADA